VHKPRETPGGWEKDRWERMNLNKARSLNFRDLVFSYIPRVMKDEIIETSKIFAIKKAKQEFDMGEAINLFLSFKKEYGIEKQAVLSFLNLTEKFDGEDFWKVKNIYYQLKRNDIKPQQIREWDKKEDVPRAKIEPRPAASSMEKTTQSADVKEMEDKSILIAQISRLAKNNGIKVEALLEHIGLKTFNSMSLDEMESLFKDFDSVKEDMQKSKPPLSATRSNTEGTKNNLL
jgi:hypothetical protein